MAWDDLFEGEQMRARVVAAGMAAALLFLGCVLARIQIVSSHRYVDSLEQQSMRRVRLPGIRGRILDRGGVCLADNRPCYCIAVFVEELRRPGPWKHTVDAVEETVGKLAKRLDLPPQTTREDIERHIQRRLAMPFLAWRDLDRRALARWAESGADLPGVDIYIEPVRVYPQGTAAAHVLGYVGKADPRQDSEEPYHFYLPEMSGSRGMEAVMNSVLTGMPGGRLLRVDASGYKHEQIAERAPECGRDVQLALDVRLQRLAEEVLVGREGAVVVLDPSNGDVLAMASSPAFDPNAFGPGLRQGEWARLLSDRSQPLVNRAIAEVYPPGSTFKPVVALAALLSDRAAPGTAFDCPGYFQLGGTRFHCWRTSGHGSLDMRGAIEQSCNSYFCQLGLRIGYDRIQAVAAGVGFGRKTGIELAGEAPGLLGGGAWKQRAHRDAWRPGDTCNASIGQGYLAVTPLQMAVLTSAIANGGRLYRPRLLRTPGGAAGEQGGPLGWTASALALVRQGMYDVVNAESGTGKRARVEGVEMAGKTGTAEYGPRGNRRKHTWMLAFAPFEHPRIALAIVIEDGMSGGITVAPRVRRLVGGYFNVEVPPVPPDEAVESG